MKKDVNIRHNRQEDLVIAGNIAFVSDLHGKKEKYLRLFRRLRRQPPSALLLGGDLLPRTDPMAFIDHFLVPEFQLLQKDLKDMAPMVGLILGNDDPREYEPLIKDGENKGIWHYLHQRRYPFLGFSVFGYSFVPPTPFLLKDWERYDVSRYVDPGSVPPNEGVRTVEISDYDINQATIVEDLDNLTREEDLARAIFLFHAPPHHTGLDRAALDGRMIDHVQVDVHVGSIAIRRFIEQRQPCVTLHGHIHESARMTGDWRDRIGKTYAFSAAHDGPEVAVVVFDPENPETAERELI